MAKSRLVGDYPVIGIRPTIDGRRGPLKVRESLEDQTMRMAKNAAKLFEENLKYSNVEKRRPIFTACAQSIYSLFSVSTPLLVTLKYGYVLSFGL